jgi:hypothetical protein
VRQQTPSSAARSKIPSPSEQVPRRCLYLHLVCRTLTLSTGSICLLLALKSVSDLLPSLQSILPKRIGSHILLRLSDRTMYRFVPTPCRSFPSPLQRCSLPLPGNPHHALRPSIDPAVDLRGHLISGGLWYGGHSREQRRCWDLLLPRLNSLCDHQLPLGSQSKQDQGAEQPIPQDLLWNDSTSQEPHARERAREGEPSCGIKGR